MVKDIVGFLIALSGIDGSGKSTISEKIKEHLNSLGYKKIVLIDAMKQGIYTQQLELNGVQEIRDTFSADIINLTWTADLIYTYENIVKSFLCSGYIVILHRSDLCCRVYSKLFSPKSTMIDKILNKYNIFYDLHIHLETIPKFAYNRISNRDGKVITEKEKYKNLIKASNLYKKYLKMSRHKNIEIVNNNFSIEDTMQKIKYIISINKI